MPPSNQTAPGYVQPTAPPWSVLALLPRPFWPWLKNYYAYASSILPLAAAGVSVASTQIQTDAWFVLLSATMTMRDTATNTVLFPSRNATVQIFDSSAGMNLFSQAVDADEFFGDAAQPGYLAYPYIFKPGGNIQTTVTNLDGTNARNLRFTYHGFKANPNVLEDDYPGVNY